MGNKRGNCVVCFKACSPGASGMCVDCFKAIHLGQQSCTLCDRVADNMAYYTSYCDCERGVSSDCTHPICGACFQGLE
jgi:hypothetical protein